MSRGYTVVEVMMALAILGVGATGVIAMQKATLIGNTSARNVATANYIAMGWAERLRTEALQWNAQNGTDDLATDTKWLTNAKTDTPLWFNPKPIATDSNGGGTSPAGLPANDIIGDEMTVTPAPPRYPAFCTKMRLTKLKLFPNPNVNDPATIRTIRAEIRVYWERSGRPVDCTEIPDPETGDNNRYGFITVTTAVIQNTSPS